MASVAEGVNGNGFYWINDSILIFIRIFFLTSVFKWLCCFGLVSRNANCGHWSVGMREVTLIIAY